MSRYAVLRRRLRCDPLTAGVIALLNWACEVPANEIRFMHLTIEIEEHP